MTDMTSNRFYLLRAFYDWIVDNDMTPYLVVDATNEEAVIPRQYIDAENKIILNIGPMAVRELDLSVAQVTFDARFSGKIMHVYLPIFAIEAIYARESGRGIVFSESEQGSGLPKNIPPSMSTPTDAKTPSSEKKVSSTSHLRIIK